MGEAVGHDIALALLLQRIVADSGGGGHCLLDIADVEPPYEPVLFEVSSAIEAALHNRLDLTISL